MVTDRVRRWLGLALSVSSESTYDRVKIGAVIAKGNRLCSAGANLCTSHPMQYRYNTQTNRLAPAHALHAEMNAILQASKSSTDLTGAVIYVSRLDRRGLPAMCRPCKACRKAILDAGIVEMYYTTRSGVSREYLR
jgi:deoxycytidylate deaminase